MSSESGCAELGGCDETLEQLGEYLDGELPEGRLEVIQDHLADCFPCADRADFEEQLRAIVKERCAESAPAGLVDAIRERLATSAEDTA